MMWSTLLLTATLVTPTAPAGDGQPPVTIIKIPEATTTTTIATAPTDSVVSPATSVLTTTSSPVESPLPVNEQGPPPLQWPSPWIALVVVGALFVLASVRHQGATLPAVTRSPDSPAPALSDPPPEGLVLALRHYKPDEGESHPATPMPESPAAVSPSSSIYYEAVEYRSHLGSSKVHARSLGEFGTLEAAINTARTARSSFAIDSGEAFWVVWNRQLKRAAWIAEAGTPAERVIDLRTPASRPASREPTTTSEVDT